MKKTKYQKLKLFQEQNHMLLKDTLMETFLVDQNSSIKIPLSALTAWKKSNGEHYTIGSLWLWLSMRDQKHSEYMRENIKLDIEPVAFNDRKEITEFFTGVTQESGKIDTAIRAQTLIKKIDIK